MKPTHSKAAHPVAQVTFWIAMALSAAALPIYAWKTWNNSTYTDFLVYHRTALRMHSGQWDQIYTLTDGTSPFRYMPLFLPLFWIFGALDYHSALFAWFLIQFSAFGLGFWILHRTLASVAPSRALLAFSISLLFTFRFCLDTLTIGQVSSLMFLGFSVGLYGWVHGRTRLFALGTLIPTLFKIGPGVLLGLVASERTSRWRQSVFSVLSLLSLVLSVSFIWGIFWTPGWPVLKQLWSGWTMIVANDSNYYDASHYGSQSLTSTLLRLVNLGVLNSGGATLLYRWIALGVCSAVGLFWLFRSPRNFLGRGLFFGLGLFPYFWFMPETFKYSLTPLAFPVAFLMAAGEFSWLGRLALGFGALTMSLAGKDLIGDTLFFGSQQASLPFLATVLLGAAVWEKAWRNSQPSSRLRLLTGALRAGLQPLPPWKTIPPARTLDVSVLVPLPLLTDSLETVEEAEKFLRSLEDTLAGVSFEILLIPYGSQISQSHPLLRPFGKRRILFHPEIQGRGEALRVGFLASHGRKVLITHLEQPCGTSFFKAALNELDQGIDLVRANRRLSESVFEIPVRVLPLVYGRHRLGLMFNRALRWILPIQTSDTHGGNLALSWSLAWQCFATQSSPGFLFDLELALVSQAQGFQEIDLPVEVHLEMEKSLSRVFAEMIELLVGLPVLLWRFKKGYYSRLSLSKAVTADDWGLTPGVNHGILELARQGVVRRVSALAMGEALEVGLAELQKLPVEMGLHFNLTYGKPLQTAPRFFQTGFVSPGKFLFFAMKTGFRGDLEEFVRLELEAQLLRLKSKGIEPRYLDGHHHIHLVPGLLDAIAPVLKKHGIEQVRVSYDRALWKTTQAPVALLAWLSRSAVKRLGFRYLPFVYPPSSVYRNPGKLRSYFNRDPGAEIIVHPAEVDDLHTLAIPDPYTAARVTEFHSLRMLCEDRTDPK